jgi:hypothetical protein
MPFEEQPSEQPGPRLTWTLRIIAVVAMVGVAATIGKGVGLALSNLAARIAEGIQ